MQTLFAISVFCFVGILWAAIALARHIKAGMVRGNPQSIVPASTDFRHHLLAAVDYKPTLVPSLIPQDAAPLRDWPAPQPQPIQQALPLSTRNQGLPKPVAPILTFTTRQARQASLHQSVHDITANKHWSFPAQAVHMEKLPLQRVASRKKTVPRKPPQPARHGPMELLDPAYYNKDLGDLTDPYQPPARLRANGRKPPSNRGF